VKAEVLQDLCHELAHLLFLRNETILIGDFLQQLAVHIAHASQRIDGGQRPPEDKTLYDHLFTQCSDFIHFLPVDPGYTL